ARTQRSADSGIGGMRAVEAITGLARYRIGHYVVTGTDRRGRSTRLPALAWFDTEHGRYTMLGDRSAAGEEVLTCTPVDRQRLLSQLTGLRDRAHRR
ncbi:ESX secretion-associated protein EspG, partial [Halopolyspora algeriensis]|uniref:ESX secretion-associated protein EspG n=1 Tax=Halopolyspora algeriensis TaxID=1500506 RepID=UPI00116A496B